MALFKPKYPLEAILNKFSIIHFAGHARIDDEHPFQSYIYLGPNESPAYRSKLKLFNVLSLNIPNVEMLVLNACNTGIGDYLSGEGLISFAWAFHYAGCPSIIMNLNETDDYAAMKILSIYYENLKEGASKSSALQMAKLEYLESVPPSKTNPKFWSNTTLIGSTAPIYSPKWQNLFVYIAGVTLLLVLGFVFRKRLFKVL
ncbi:MAG: CHAT domain-containing protein [Bacteroidales bacterium]|nr:CHAT domain-containing protein [Bacteroidales bacterium]MCF8388516.1 CHAT domain-containing protein [Bacteroidales bacterium]MCF8399526.1 CHAT domain-containing protein [Bacteroidales bacterium]